MKGIPDKYRPLVAYLIVVGILLGLMGAIAVMVALGEGRKEAGLLGCSCYCPDHQKESK